MKCVLLEYRTLLVKMNYDQFVEPALMAAKINYKLMVDINYLLTLVTVKPLLKVVKALIIFA